MSKNDDHLGEANSHVSSFPTARRWQQLESIYCVRKNVVRTWYDIIVLYRLYPRAIGDKTVAIQNHIFVAKEIQTSLFKFSMLDLKLWALKCSFARTKCFLSLLSTSVCFKCKPLEIPFIPLDTRSSCPMMHIVKDRIFKIHSTEKKKCIHVYCN